MCHDAFNMIRPMMYILVYILYHIILSRNISSSVIVKNHIILYYAVHIALYRLDDDITLKYI